MTKNRKPIPKSQIELSQNQITAYDSGVRPLAPQKHNRGHERSMKDSDVKPFSVGFKDIDEAVLYYFKNVIRLSVNQNGTQVPVPILYGSPERWKSVQKDGFYRDKNGKIQTPLVMFKTNSIEKNRNLGNKLDANNPINLGVFQKTYSRKNVYDRFSVINSRIPITEFYGVIIPDYVNVTYNCIVFTEYVEQMNKIIESINYASDSYWGDKSKYRFRAMIDTYTPVVQMNQGEDRTVKTTFTVKLLGHIVPDSVNSNVASIRKYFSKASVRFSMETAGSTETMTAKLQTPEKSSGLRFYDINEGRVVNNINLLGKLQEGVDYIVLGDILDSNEDANILDINAGTITFINKTLVNIAGNVAVQELLVKDFKVFINGQAVEPSAILSINQVSGDIIVTFNSPELDYLLEVTDEILLMGREGDKLYIPQRDYVVTAAQMDSNILTAVINIGGNNVTFNNQTLLLPSSNTVATFKEDFSVYLNGLVVNPSAITSILQSGTDITIQFNSNLGYLLAANMQVVIHGRDAEVGVQLPDAERDYLLLNTVLDTNTNTNVITPGSNTVTFTNQTIATPPSGYPTPGISDFIVYVSGLRIEPVAINSITQVGSGIVITFNAGLNFSLSVGMEILLIGKILN